VIFALLPHNDGVPALAPDKRKPFKSSTVQRFKPPPLHQQNVQAIQPLALFRKKTAVQAVQTLPPLRSVQAVTPSQLLRVQKFKAPDGKSSNRWKPKLPRSAVVAVVFLAKLDVNHKVGKL
jgi:hypothetical protein